MSRAIRQPVYKSGPNAKHQARVQLSHMNQPIQSIVNGTITLSEETSQVVERDGSYLVRSPKFAGRYYQVIRTEGRWLTSSNEEKFQSILIRQVEQFIAGQYQQAA